MNTIVSLPGWLLICYFLFIQHERGGLWKVFKLVSIPAWFLDAGLNYTLFSICFWKWPGKSYTFSKQLANLRVMTDWRGPIGQALADLLNAIDPSGKHIK